ncbi:MAG: acetyl-CoA carboxylase carboxyltransferase subunit alpha [Pseudomonadota bacterium]
MSFFLDFESSLEKLEERILDIQRVRDENEDGDYEHLEKEISRLQDKFNHELKRIYLKLTPWQKVQIARHQSRPHFTDVCDHLLSDFVPLSGDRLYGEDHALIGGLATFNGHSVVVLGHEKGQNTQDRILRNFGMARPEGYRKAQRLMRLAEQFKLPLLSFIDTSGAYPGVGAEERGQAEAIAQCLRVSLSLKIPTMAIILGEGGSGGAIAIATCDRVLMFEHSIYSVISPEGCASILWRDATRAEQASEALKLTAQDLESLYIIDEIISEPLGGAHRNHKLSLHNLKNAMATHLDHLLKIEQNVIVEQRHKKYLQMGRNL